MEGAAFRRPGLDGKRSGEQHGQYEGRRYGQASLQCVR